MGAIRGNRGRTRRVGDRRRSGTRRIGPEVAECLTCPPQRSDCFRCTSDGRGERLEGRFGSVAPIRPSDEPTLVQLRSSIDEAELRPTGLETSGCAHAGVQCQLHIETSRSQCRFLSARMAGLGRWRVPATRRKSVGEGDRFAPEPVRPVPGRGSGTAHPGLSLAPPVSRLTYGKPCRYPPSSLNRPGI